MPENEAVIREARLIISGQLPLPDVWYIRKMLEECRNTNNEDSLALWSRIRWMWVKRQGKNEVDV